jgi:LPS-assembly lipoprotein
MSWFREVLSFPRTRESSVFRETKLGPRVGGKTLGPRLRGDDEPRLALLAALAACAVLVSSCGFQLRGQATYAFRSIYVNAPAYPALAADLRRSLTGSGSATVAETPAAAQVIVDVTLIADDKQVLSLSPGGRAQEYTLAKVITFRVHDPEGREWLKPDEIVVRRTYTYDDTERLAREIQEQRLLRDMQTDAVQQIVRRLQAARPPA